MHKILTLFFVIGVVVSCSNASETVQMKSINGTWNKKAKQQFDFKISDAQHAKNIIFVIRNNNDYPYSNIRLIVDFTDHQSKRQAVDTLNDVLAKPNGEWIGKGFGDTKETLFQYKINYKFPHNGDYSVSLIQAMRTDNLKGIEDIGVKLEPAKP